MSSAVSETPRRPYSPGEDAPTTDFALIEEQKENIRPLASGRSAATLGALFDKEAEETQRVIAEQDAQHRRDIEEAERRDREGEDMADGVQDVLDVYSRYVAFIVQHYPSSPSHVLPLLENTTRRFVDDARYTQDVRYLKLWTMFARHVERREEVWAFLESRDIGTRHAAFYEEWATAAEGLGRKKKADDAYRLGIARKAAPLERLKNRHQAFLTRIMVSSSRDIPDEDPALPPPSTASQRNVLGALRASTAAQTPVSAASRSRGANGSKLAVFSDDTAAAEDPERTPWDDFGTRDGRRKENVVEAGPWKGETLAQNSARHRVAPRTPKIEVFKDAGEVQPSAVQVTDVIRAKQPMSEADLLRSDPLRFYDTSKIDPNAPIPGLPAPPSSRKPAKKKRELAAFQSGPWECPAAVAETMGTSGKIERRMFDWEGAFKGGEEWSFEEVRARKRGLLGNDWKEFKDWERNWHKPGASTPQAPRIARAPSPTLNTKLASAEVMDLFNQTLHGGQRRTASSDESDDDDDDEAADMPQPLPTPLPQPRAAPVAMMTPGMGVPPTPTPAPRLPPPATPNIFATENASTKLQIFDENAENPPQSTRKLQVFDENVENTASDENAVPGSVKRGAFGQTPARQVLGSRTPLSSANPFPVYEDENTPLHPSTQRNIFAQQPAVEAIPEAAEEETEQPAEEKYVDYQEEYNYYEERYGREAPRARSDWRPDLLTPVTERTLEYTTGTTRSRRTSGWSEDGDDAVSSHAAETLASVAEEEERSRSRAATHSPETTRSGDINDADRSGLVDTGVFSVPDGYTIACRLEASERNDTTHSQATDDAFVTAQYGETGKHASPARFALEPPVAELAELAVEPSQSLAKPEAEPEQTTLLEKPAPHTIATAPTPSPDVAEESPASVPAAPPSLGSELPNPCNAADETTTATLLQRIQPPLSALPDIHIETSGSHRLAAMQRVAKLHARRSSSASMRMSMSSEDSYVLPLGSTSYEVNHKLGEGGFGAVFLGVDTAAREAADAIDDDASDSEDESEDLGMVAIKVERPACIWEAVVLQRVHARIASELAPSIIRPRGLWAFADESFLLLDYSRQGTLLDIVNKATVWGIAPIPNGPSVPDELVALFFVAELLRLVEGLHAANFIHGDLKIDNCLVRLDSIPASEGGNTKWDQQYSRVGAGGWKHKGVKLIDFGRAIDLDLFPAGRAQRFVADWKTDDRDCVEMREGRAWSYEADYTGLASIAYCLLFGKFLKTEKAGDGYKIDQPLKRYWQTDMWTKFFDALLNPRAFGELPITSKLSEVRNEFEAYLEVNCQKHGKSLKQLLKRIELRAMEARR